MTDRERALAAFWEVEFRRTYAMTIDEAKEKRHPVVKIAYAHVDAVMAALGAKA